MCEQFSDAHCCRLYYWIHPRIMAVLVYSKHSKMIHCLLMTLHHLFLYIIKSPESACKMLSLFLSCLFQK